MNAEDKLEKADIRESRFDLQDRPDAKISSILTLRDCITLILGPSIQNQNTLEIAQSILNTPTKWEDPRLEEQAFFRSMEVDPYFPTRNTKLTSLQGERLAGAFHLSQRYHQERSFRRSKAKKILGSTIEKKALQSISFSLRAAHFEWIGFVPLLSNYELGSFCIVEKGARTHVNFDPRELFSAVLALRSKGFYLYHNHPSGDLTPSAQDYQLTRQVESIGNQLHTPLLNHWVVSSVGQAKILFSHREHH